MENRDDQNQNQTGQQGQPFTDKQSQQDAGQQGQTSTGQTGSDQGGFGESGGDTTLAQGQKSQSDQQSEDQSSSNPGFVGSKKEDSSDAYLSEGDTAKPDFAEKGQGATETGNNEDIESGKPAARDATLDDAS